MIVANMKPNLTLQKLQMSNFYWWYPMMPYELQQMTAIS